MIRRARERAHFVRRRGAARVRCALLAVLAVLGSSAMAADAARAQQVALKRAVPDRDTAACPRVSVPATPPRAQRERARRLVAEGHAAAIVGDDDVARDRFEQAARLDPASADIAYELARAYEGSNDAAAASREYCRYLSLAPDSSGAADARARIVALTPRRTQLVSDQAAARFRSGLDHFDRRQWDAAITAFTRAIALAPTWATPYYDRALALASAGQSRLARRDFETYLRLDPNAPDSGAVATRIAGLRDPGLDPTVAFASGLVPGVGQLYTHRPALGLAVLGAVVGATYWAMHSEHVTHMQSYTDPNGYTFQYPVTTLERPHLTAGIATASAITLLGALEAYRYAKRNGGGASSTGTGDVAQPAARSVRASPTLAPGGVGVQLTVHLPLSFR